MRSASLSPTARRPARVRTSGRAGRFGALLAALALALALAPCAAVAWWSHSPALRPAHAQEADNPEARLLKRAAMFAGRSQFPQAIALLDKVLADNPRSSRAAELRGYARMKLHDYDRACEDFARGDPSAAYHDVNHGYCLRKIGRLQEAHERFARAVGALDPADTWYAYARDQAALLAPVARAKTVLVLLDAGNHLAVQAADGKTLARAAKGTEVGLALDDLLAPTGSVDLRIVGVAVDSEPAWRVRLFHERSSILDERRAARLGERALAGIACDLHVTVQRDASGRVSVTRKEQGLDLDAVLEAARAAEARWAEGATEAAVGLAEDAQRRFPAIDLFPRWIAERHEEQAALLPVEPATLDERKRLLGAARTAWLAWLAVRRKVAALAPDDPKALLAAGQAALQLGEAAEAEQHYRAVLLAAPNHPLGLIGQAQALTRLGRAREALAVADRALADHPRWPYAHVIRGDAQLALDDGEAALLAYGRAAELDPSQGEWIYAKIAVAANQGGANGPAIAKAEAAVAERALDPAAMRDLGFALLRGLRFEEAHTVFQHVLSLDGAQPGALPLAGLAAELAGDAKSAVRAYRRAPEVAAQIDGGALTPQDHMAVRRGERLIAIARALKEESPARAAAGAPLERAKPGAARDRARAALSAIQEIEPRLVAGLVQLPPLVDGEITEGEATALERVADLARASRQDKEARLGLQLIARQAQRRRDGDIQIDGALGDWMRADRVAEDPTGDHDPRRGDGADLTELYAVVSGDRLFVAWRTAGPPSPADASLWIEVRGEPLYGAIAVGVTGGEVQLVQAIPGREVRRREGRATSVRAAVGAAVEAEIPLRWLNGARRVRVSAYTLDPATGQRLDEIAEHEPVARLDDGYPPAVLALFRLAEGGPLEPARVATAIALGSSDVWAIGGREVEERAANDDRRMLALARRIDAQATERGLTPLASMRLEALLTWANRSVQHRPSTPAGAIRYTISLDALTAMEAYAVTHGLLRGSAPETVAAIEAHLTNPLRWQYTSASAVERGARLSRGELDGLSERERRDLDKFVRPCVVDGMKLTTDGHFTQDLLFDHLVGTDALVGHCGNMAQLTVDLCRALGIPATIVQGREEVSSLFQNPHAFPVYYDGQSAWRSVQGQRYSGQKQLTLYFFLPTAPIELPAGAATTGAGTHWFRQDTTYDETGLLFRRGDPAAWYRQWLERVAAGE